jgi:hypothetical protein
MRISRAGNDVVISGEDKRFFMGQEFRGMGPKSLEPLQLIGIFRACHRVFQDGVPVREVDRGNAHSAALGGHNGFDISSLLIAVVTGEAAAHIFEREFGEQGDTIVTFLSMGLDVITERFDFEAGKSVVDGFDFLQASNIGLLCLQPCSHSMKPGFY